jgi:hypothetical protein
MLMPLVQSMGSQQEVNCLAPAQLPGALFLVLEAV